MVEYESTIIAKIDFTLLCFSFFFFTPYKCRIDDNLSVQTVFSALSLAASLFFFFLLAVGQKKLPSSEMSKTITAPISDFFFFLAEFGALFASGQCVCAFTAG